LAKHRHSTQNGALRLKGVMIWLCQLRHED
jgi:hypothetical protein